MLISEEIWVSGSIKDNFFKKSDFQFQGQCWLPFNSESKNTSGCSNSLISKKVTPHSFFHSTNNKNCLLNNFIQEKL